jgi:hypothetical protein
VTESAPDSVLRDPVLRERYREQVDVGCAVYIDGVMNTWDEDRFIGHYLADDAERLQVLERNMYHCARIADRDSYVWTWSEAVDWWGITEYPPPSAELVAAIDGSFTKQVTGEPLGFGVDPIIDAAFARGADHIWIPHWARR